MKSKLMLASVLLLFALTPLMAGAATLEGTIQGYQCVTQGKTCPIGQEDPLAAAENVFVIQTKSNDYYFIPNIDRATLARHINDVVRVNGTVDSRYKSITADSFEYMKNGMWVTAWSPKMQDELENGLYKGNK
ncbi:MAG: hypothetical protein EHM45_02490 [Desulfobacteraceae bacterium]|nr:MAG: hypothetical protein EHM45_02490 [Desulfobacteraceae bacterium]